MSLLEDVFLEDEAGEAQELERVIEGDEYDDRPQTPNSNENSEKEDEAEEDKRRVDHTAKAKRAVKNPRFVLNPARLTGPRGIQVIPEHFKNFQFKGKGHEKEDLDYVLKKLEHWAYRLYPKFQFDDCLKKIETLGKKRPVMVHLHKIRTDQFTSEETVVQQDSSGDEAPIQEEDEFDRLLQQQIELARATPAPGSVRKEFETPSAHRTSLTAPKATSSPSISDEQKERMMRNRKLAEERRLARLKMNNTSVNGNSNNNSVIENVIEEKEPAVNNTNNTDRDDAVPIIRKHNRSNVVDSSDDENGVMTGVRVTRDDDVALVRKHRSNVIDSSDDDDVMTVKESVTVDVHSTTEKVDADHSDKENREFRVNSERNTNSIDVDIDFKEASDKNTERLMELESNEPKITNCDLDKSIEESCDKNNENVIEKESNELEGKNCNLQNQVIFEDESSKTNEKESPQMDIVNSSDDVRDNNGDNESSNTILQSKDHPKDSLGVNDNNDNKESTNTILQSTDHPKGYLGDANDINNDQDSLNAILQSADDSKDTEKATENDEVADLMDVEFTDDF